MESRRVDEKYERIQSARELDHEAERGKVKPILKFMKTAIQIGIGLRVSTFLAECDVLGNSEFVWEDEILVVH
jgi:hypothetical protein